MRALFFVPFSNIWKHNKVQAVLANQLQLMGHEALMVRCNSTLNSYCPSMAELRLKQNAGEAEKKRVCESCVQRSRLTDSKFGFSNLLLDDFLTYEDIEEVESWVANLSVKSWHSFEVDGVPLGRYSSYEFLLNNKLNSWTIPEHHFDDYVNQFRNTGRAFLASRKFLSELKPDVVLVDNGLYSANRAVIHVAQDLGIDSFSIGIGTDRDAYGKSFTIFKNMSHEILISRSSAWYSASDIPISKVQVKLVADSFMSLSAGTSPFSYTSASKGQKDEELHTALGTDPFKKTALVLMASADERFAADVVNALPYSIRDVDTKNFSSQIEWLQWIIQYFNDAKDWQLIIRPHPRLYPNKRDGVLSEAGKDLANFFRSLPSNVLVNTPEQEISLYDLAQIIDVGINATSSSGLELLSLGMPQICIEPERLFSYPAEFNSVPTGEKNLLDCMETLADSGWSIENIRKAYRWRNFMHQQVACDISDALVDRPEDRIRNLRNRRILLGNKIPNWLLNQIDLKDFSKEQGTIPAGRTLEDVLLHGHPSLAEACKRPKDNPPDDVSVESETDSLIDSTRIFVEKLYGYVPKKMSFLN